MKSLRLLSVALPALVIAACSSQAGVNGTGGHSATGGSLATTGGATGSGGVGTDSGGSNGSGGSGLGTGGDSTGSGGSTDGTGGDMTTGTGGRGNGGSNGTGGSTGPGGSNGSGGAAGGDTGGPVTVDSFAGIPNTFGESLKNSFFIVPCYSAVQQDCNTIPSGMACGNQSGPFEMQGVTQTETFKVGGATGTMYNMTFKVTGITEAKYYMGGKRDAGDGPVANAQDAKGTDTFYTGGSPVAVEHYNIYKLIVKDATGKEVQHYYLNSFPKTTVAYENHQSFVINYMKTIPVPGGGSIDYFMGDSNCRAINNCGPGVFSGSCSSPRSLPETGFKVPTMYMGKSVASLNTINQANEPYHAQLIHIVVTDVTKM